MDKTKYLPEDHDLLEELEKSGALTEGLNSDSINKVIQIVQIKTLLRSRKEARETEKSNNIYSNVILAFAIIQVVIAILQFGFSVMTTEDYSREQIFGIVAIFICSAFMYYTLRRVEKMKKE